MGIVFLVLKLAGLMLAGCAALFFGIWQWEKNRAILALVFYALAAACFISVPVLFWVTIGKMIISAL